MSGNYTYCSDTVMATSLKTDLLPIQGGARSVRVIVVMDPQIDMLKAITRRSIDCLNARREGETNSGDGQGTGKLFRLEIYLG